MKHRIKAVGELVFFTSFLMGILLSTMMYDNQKKSGQLSFNWLKLPGKYAVAK